MPNTKDEWGRRVEKAVETLGEAAAMGMVPAEKIVQMVQNKAQEFEGNVPRFQEQQAPGGAPMGPPPGGPPGAPPGGPPAGGPPMGGPPSGPPGMDPEMAMERMPQDDFKRMRDDVARGRMGGGSPQGPPMRR